MAKKSKSLYRYLLGCLLVLLGFSSCSKDGEGEDIVCMYGSPSAWIHVDANVVDEANNPVQGARVVVRFGKYSRATTYFVTSFKIVGTQQIIIDSTDASGHVSGLMNSGIPDNDNTYIVYRSRFSPTVSDKYPDDSVKVVPVLEKEGDGGWDLGTYKVTGTLKLKPKPSDE